MSAKWVIVLIMGMVGLIACAEMPESPTATATAVLPTTTAVAATVAATETAVPTPVVAPTEAAATANEAMAPAAPSTPLQVTLTMTEPPQLGELAPLTLTVQSAFDAPNTEVMFELPEGVSMVSGELSWSGDLAANEMLVLAATLRFSEPGEYTLRGQALQPVNEDMIWSGDDYIYLTITPDESFFGLASGENVDIGRRQGEKRPFCRCQFVPKRPVYCNFSPDFARNSFSSQASSVS